VNSILISKLV